MSETNLVNDAKIAFIGAGNMAAAIIAGLVKQGVAPANIEVCAPSEGNRARLASEYGVVHSADNNAAAAKADILVLAVKPQMMREVCAQLAEHRNPNSVVLSVAAGITCQSLANWLATPAQPAENIAVVRTMPNTPSHIGLGACGLFASSAVAQTQKDQAQAIMAAVGLAVWVNSEDEINIVTAVSGSGPAYFFLVFEAMIDAAEKMGLDRQTAAQLTLQTALGAAKLAQTSEDDAVTLRKKVTSPNGTTERAIASFEQNKLRDTFAEAMQACSDRAQQLATELAK